MNDYAHPEALVETDWLAEHLNDPSLRIAESNEDILLYDTGHIAGAVHIDWRRDLQDQVQRDYINPAQFAQLAGRNGIGKDTTVVFYGDKANWWAAYALWSSRLFGHENVKLLNGGRMKWIAEGRPLTREVPRYSKSEYPNPAARDDSGIRAHSKKMPWRSATRAKPSSKFDCPENSAVRLPTCPNIRRKAFYAVVTFQGQRTFRGKLYCWRASPSV
jgi:thiosulfate/3-mercaptopyruvate sulfurtransferase